jgi:hypothetical protein
LCLTWRGKRCNIEGCKASAIGKTDTCKRHGGGKRCNIEGCKASARGKTDTCVLHGGGKRCNIEGCKASAIGKTDTCVLHGGGKRCNIEGCKSSAIGKTDTCVLHGGGKRCPNCIDWIDSRSGCKKYDGYCATCFKKVFPNDKRSKNIYEKSKENKVRNFLNENFTGFIHDKPMYTGNCDCTHRRRIDHRLLIGNTMLCIETDEFQHSSYDKEDEKLRYDDLCMIFSGKWIFIRFNPDNYTIKNKKMNPPLETRFVSLKEMIENQIERINKEENIELLEIIKMYYTIF